RIASRLVLSFFFFNETPATEFYPLSLHDALPICRAAEQLTDPEQLQGAATEGQLELLRPQEVAVQRVGDVDADPTVKVLRGGVRSEEHTSELQSPCNLVCRLLLEKKKARTS